MVHPVYFLLIWQSAQDVEVLSRVYSAVPVSILSVNPLYSTNVNLSMDPSAGQYAAD
jgi:hypothetical protein